MSSTTTTSEEDNNEDDIVINEEEEEYQKMIMTMMNQENGEKQQPSHPEEKQNEEKVERVERKEKMERTENGEKQKKKGSKKADVVVEEDDFESIEPPHVFKTIAEAHQFLHPGEVYDKTMLKSNPIFKAAQKLYRQRNEDFEKFMEKLQKINPMMYEYHKAKEGKKKTNKPKSNQQTTTALSNGHGGKRKAVTLSTTSTGHGNQPKSTELALKMAEGLLAENILFMRLHVEETEKRLKVIQDLSK